MIRRKTRTLGSQQSNRLDLLRGSSVCSLYGPLLLSILLHSLENHTNQTEKRTTMPPQEGGAPQIYISRNKHLPYIASYHGPWLSLPIDLLQSLLVLNAETAVPSSSPTASSLPQTTRSPSVPNGPSLQVNGDASTTAVVQKKRGAEAQPAPTKSPVSPAAPPLDPVIFKSLVAIRKLVDDASELVSLQDFAMLLGGAMGN